jgi:hypothetical protein
LGFIPSTSNSGTSTPWIEKVLADTPIDDYRKLTVALILSRYLINVKKLDYDPAYAIIWEWFEAAALKIIGCILALHTTTLYLVKNPTMPLLQKSNLRLFHMTS